MKKLSPYRIFKLLCQKTKAHQEEHEKIKEYGESINEERRNKK